MTEFKPGKYRTMDGRDAVVLCNDAPGSWPLVGYVVSMCRASPYSWMLDGSYGGSSEHDLMPPAPEEVVRWVNLWKGGIVTADTFRRAGAAASRRVVLTPNRFDDADSPSEFDQGWNAALDTAAATYTAEPYTRLTNIVKRLRRSAS